jgi:hypothetical protein
VAKESVDLANCYDAVSHLIGNSSSKFQGLQSDGGNDAKRA